MSDDARALIQEHVARRSELERESAQADWQLACTGEEKWEQESVRLGTALRELLSDRDVFRRLEGLRGHVDDADLARQVELLYLDAAKNRTDPALLAELVKLETRAEATFSRFRPVVDGKPLSENDLRRVLRTSQDDALRRRTWEAGKEIGREIAPICLEMVELRNRAAREAGWSDYHTMGLKLQEIEPDFLFDDILGKLEELTEEPFGDAAAGLFARLETRFGLEPGKVRPWHLSDPFFQEAVAPPELDLGRFFEGADLVELSRRTLTDMGFDVNDVLDRSDLFPREGKNQHAFCAHVDRMTDDVRVLANCEADEIWMDTMLHELGHAVYDLGLDRDLPWLLREAAHLITTEAVALLFGRIATDPDWMIRVLGASADDVDPLRGKLAEHVRFKQLLFPRWVMVMVHFERELYSDPKQDLDRLWWDLVERFQKVPRPENRREPDWASKIHVGLAPVYYQNYLLGDLMASQLDALLRSELGTPHWWGDTGTAGILGPRLFRDGARFPWSETVKRATGRPLDPHHYVKQFVHASA